MKLVKRVQAILPLLTFITIWQFLSSSGVVNQTLFPPPTKVFSSFIYLLKTGNLLKHSISSLWRVIIGLFVGSLFGIIAGLLTGRKKAIDKALGPLFQTFRSFPPVAIIPLIIVWLGVGQQAKIFSISFAVFFPVWINTHIGALRIPSHYLQAASLLTTSAYKKWVKLVFPASLPFIVAGIRSAIGIAFIMVFVSEIAGSSTGIGYLISTSHLSYRIDNMIVGLILLGFYGTITDILFSKTCKRFFPWLKMV